MESTTGRILQFDEMRGFGFIAADDGGEDVFLHASVFAGEPGELLPGARIEFQIMAGDRGRKAFAARLAEEGSSPAESSADSPAERMEPLASTPPPGTVGERRAGDVLSRTAFLHEVTELLLDAAPSLTGGQLVQARRGLVELAQKRGWVDA